MLTRTAELFHHLQRVILTTANISALVVVAVVVGLSFLGRVPLFGLTSLVVFSNSMQPTVAAGDVIVVARVPSWQIGSRDVVAFTDPIDRSRIVTHRVAVARFENGRKVYYTQGDANETIDRWKVGYADILGKMVFRLPLVGYIVDLAKKPIGFLMFIFLPGIYLIAAEVANIYRYLKQLEEKRQYGQYDINSQVFA